MDRLLHVTIIKVENFKREHVVRKIRFIYVVGVLQIGRGSVLLEHVTDYVARGRIVLEVGEPTVFSCRMLEYTLRFRLRLLIYKLEHEVVFAAKKNSAPGELFAHPGLNIMGSVPIPAYPQYHALFSFYQLFLLRFILSSFCVTYFFVDCDIVAVNAFR